MPSYISAFIILALVLAALVIGPESLNISLRYYDSILHFTGGVGIGFFVHGLARSFTPLLSRDMITLVSGVLFVGLVWEIFEWYYDIPGYPLWTKLYYMDTTKDLVLDLVGGCIALYIGIKSASSRDASVVE